MINKLVRIRERNQITVPSEICSALGLKAGDFVQITLDDMGHIQLTPARLATIGTPEAEEEVRRAQDDIQAGRYETFESAQAFADHLIARHRSAHAARNRERLREKNAALAPKSPGRRPSGESFAKALRAVLREEPTIVQGEPVERSDAFVLKDYSEAKDKPDLGATIALLSIGDKVTSINIIRDGEPVFTREVSLGTEQYSDALQTELNRSIEDAERVKGGKSVSAVEEERKSAILRSVLKSDVLIQEIRKTFDFFRFSVGGDIHRIYCPDVSARAPGLLDLLHEEFGKPVEKLYPYVPQGTAKGTTKGSPH